MPRGVRLNPKHDERTRAKIQASQIINRLADHINGKCELSATQVRAGEILLRKVMPDLSTHHVEGQVTHSFVDFLRGVEQLRRAELPAPVVDILPEPQEVRH